MNIKYCLDGYLRLILGTVESIRQMSRQRVVKRNAIISSLVDMEMEVVFVSQSVSQMHNSKILRTD
ncbi:MAG TPA: hypothetical protein VFR94_06500 [Nitrososphaeraceae archaeon]|nr:hypothetical protein [Nitrososphaeraceae archaeon]